MVFPNPRPWIEVAHPVSAGQDLEAHKASVEPAIALTLLSLPVSASALPEDLYPVKLPATRTESHVPQDNIRTPTARQLDSPHIDTTGCEVHGGPKGVAVCPPWCYS